MRFLIPFIALVLAVLVFSVPSIAQENNADAVDFSAENITIDAESGTLIATGEVVLKQDALSLTADRIQYDRNNGSAFAQGNVVFTDREGGKHYTETLYLEEGFARAFAEPVISNLADGSWVSANNINHHSDNGTEFNTTRFTPCHCNFREDETPNWEFRTNQTIHNKNTQEVSHRHTQMRIYGVPIMYFPYLAHPDWTVRRTSGFLPPRFSYSSSLGTTYSQPYYWVTGRTHDLQITPHFFSIDGEAAQLNYRQYWNQSNLNAFVTGGQLNTYKAERENVISVNARFTTLLGDRWHTETHINRVSRDTFLRRYNFDDAEYLKTYAQTERIDKSQYSLIEAYNMQNLRHSTGKQQEPLVFPHIFHERYLESPRPDMSLRLRLSATNLNNDDHTDVKKWTSDLYALERINNPFGIISAEAATSVQYRNIQTAVGDNGYTGELGLGSIAVGLGWSKPITTMLANRAAVIEPKLKFVSVKATEHDDKIPNRDSADFRLDEANLFLLHREQGEDYIKTQARLDGGIMASIYDSVLGDVSGFIGTSMRVAGDTPTIGLNAAEADRFSDILANFSIQPEEHFSLSWAGRFRPSDYRLNESKVITGLDLGASRFRLIYTQLEEAFFRAASEEKEQLIFRIDQKLPSDWEVSLRQEYNKINNKRELTDSSFIFTYGGGIQDCLEVSIGYTRKGITDRDIRPSEDIFILFSFKYLGTAGRSNQDEDLTRNVRSILEEY